MTRVVQAKIQSVRACRAPDLRRRNFALRAWLDPVKLARFEQRFVDNDYYAALGKTKKQTVRVDLSAATNRHSVPSSANLVVKQIGTAGMRSGPFSRSQAPYKFERLLEIAQPAEGPFMQDSLQILIVDDDLEIRKLLGHYLTEQGFRVTLASDKRTLVDALRMNVIDLIILDILLPDGSGLEICQDMRSEGSNVPIILLTALKEDIDRIIGMEIGADDYLCKPFNPRELSARVRAVLRRQKDASTSPQNIQEYHFEGFRLQPSLRQVFNSNDELLELTGAEFELLHALVARSGRLLSRDFLLEVTSRSDVDVFDRSIDVLLSRIRKKLGDNSFQIIKTIRNGGYIFTASVVRSGGIQ